jgi:hypothetical protein
MHVFRELFIRGKPEQLVAVAEDICRSLNEGWTRDADAEAHMQSAAVSGGRNVYCFACSKRPRRPAATVFLIEEDKDAPALHTANVVPHEKHELSRNEYNGIVEEFFRRFAEPAAERTGARAELTEPQADLERWLSPSTAKKLRAFCTVANKHTGSSHPMDRNFWYDFIVSAHEEGAEFSASTLARWLCEEGGWDEDLAEELAIEYEFARGLLAFTNGQKVGA